MLSVNYTVPENLWLTFHSGSFRHHLVTYVHFKILAIPILFSMVADRERWPNLLQYQLRIQSSLAQDDTAVSENKPELSTEQPADMELSEAPLEEAHLVQGETSSLGKLLMKLW
jgi:hypothetical protein